MSRERNAKESMIATSQKRGGRGAFSLVEVILSIGLLAFSFLVLLGLMPVGLSALNDSGKQMAAESIFAAIGSELRQTEWTNLSDYTETFPRYYDMRGNAVVNSSGSIYMARVSVSPLPPSSSGALPSSTANVRTVVISLGRQTDPMQTTNNVVNSTFLVFNRNPN